MDRDETIYQLKKQVEMSQKLLKFLFERYGLDYEAELTKLKGERS